MYVHDMTYTVQNNELLHSNLCVDNKAKWKGQQQSDMLFWLLGKNLWILLVSILGHQQDCEHNI